MCAEKSKDNLEGIDFSVIRKGIEAGGKMIEQILNGIHYGTPEIQNLMYNESDIILECKVCRNLFRALPNFVAHKRIYCLESYVNIAIPLIAKSSVEETIVVQPESPDDDGKASLPTLRNAKSSETKKMETIKCQVESQAGPSASDFYTDVCERLEVEKKNRCRSIMRLEPISGNSIAMRVVSVDLDETDEENDIKIPETSNQEIKEADDNVEKPAEVYKSEEKVATFPISAKLSSSKVSAQKLTKQKAGPKFSQNTIQLSSKSKPIWTSKATYEMADIKHLKCRKCSRQMSSRKSLINHIVNLHGNVRQYFSCPYCKKGTTSFRYFWGLIRHIYSIHKIKKHNISKKMRQKLRANSWFENHDAKLLEDSSSQSPDSQKKKIVPVKSASSKRKVESPNSKTKKEQEKEEVKATHKQQTLEMPQFSSGRKLYVCEHCSKLFGKKKSMEEHLKQCDQWISKPANLAETGRILSKSCGIQGIRRKTTFITRYNAENDVLDKNLVKTEVTTTKSKASTAGKGSTVKSAEVRQKGKSSKCLSGSGEQDSKVAEESTTNLRPKRQSKLVTQDGSKENLQTVEEIWVSKSPGKPIERVKSSRRYVLDVASKPTRSSQCQDTKKLLAIINTASMQCLCCNRKFNGRSHLRRHAVRHLGWKRYKCKLCMFTSYDRSECSTHIKRRHLGKIHGLTIKALDYYIVDLNKEGAKVRNEKKQQAMTNKKKNDGKNAPVAEKPAKSKKSQEDCKKITVKVEPGNSSQFNMSTRTSPRVFDPRPLQNMDGMSILFTRRGFYPKPKHYGKLAVETKTKQTSKSGDAESHVQANQ